MGRRTAERPTILDGGVCCRTGGTLASDSLRSKISLETGEAADWDGGLAERTTVSGRSLSRCRSSASRSAVSSFTGDTTALAAGELLKAATLLVAIIRGDSLADATIRDLSRNMSASRLISACK